MDFDFQEIKKVKGHRDRETYKGVYLGKESLTLPLAFMKLVDQARYVKLYLDRANNAIAVQPITKSDVQDDNVFRISYSHNKGGKVTNGSLYIPRGSGIFDGMEQGRYYFKEITVDGKYVCVKQ